MLKYKTLSRLSIAGLVAAALAAPVLAQAAVCAGNRVNWNIASRANGLNCGLINRGTSIGGFLSFPGGQLANSLTVNLINGIHASGIGYFGTGNVMVNCNPFDDTAGDGGRKVGQPGCLGGVQHQVIVAF